MSVKDHYQKHLSAFYAWMSGDFESKRSDFERFLDLQNIRPNSTASAIDLGAGQGIQSAALAKRGFNVLALDFDSGLLNELKENCKDLNVVALDEDIRHIKNYAGKKPELISCCGDTLTHLGTIEEILTLITDCYTILEPQGVLLLSFRDYTADLHNNDRFIPVKSDHNRILTCFLEYNSPTQVQVTDLLHEFNGTHWEQKISSYTKTRIPPAYVGNALKQLGMKILYNEPINRLYTIIAQKRD